MAWYKIVDGNKRLGSHMDSKSADIALNGIKAGTFFGGDKKKRPSAKKVRMTQAEINSI